MFQTIKAVTDRAVMELLDEPRTFADVVGCLYGEASGAQEILNDLMRENAVSFCAEDQTYRITETGRKRLV